MLLVAVAAGLLVGIELVSAATGDSGDFWDLIPAIESGVARAAVICGLAVLFATAMAVTAWPRRADLVLAADDGVVLLPHAAVIELVERQFGRVPDVVRARADVCVGGEGLIVDLRVYARPGADAARLEAEVRAAGAAGVRCAVGVEPRLRRFRLRVLKVNDLARYL